MTLVVVAYGGWNDVFTRALFDVANDGGAFPEVIWTFYQNDESAVRDASAPLLEKLRPGLQRGRVTLYGGIDCHRFFRTLWERLQASRSVDPVVAAPTLGVQSTPARRSPFVVGAPIEHDEDFFGRRAQCGVLRDAIENGQPVQILGERRMGKTSLLRWVERHAKEWQKRPVAWINAQGLAGHSPEKLVLEAAWSLARLPEAEAALQRLGPGSAAAAEVFRGLLPLVLLVDEASALARPGHGFDEDFLGALRAFGQERQLLWISTSHEDLQRLFHSTGLTSSFLNDSRQVWVGQLEEDAARDLIARAEVESMIAAAMEEAGGFAFGLQWLGDALMRQPDDRDSVRDGYAEAMEPLFRRWWAERGTDERKLLVQGLSGIPVSELSDRVRRRARALERLGFLVQREERFVVPGAAWQAFVEEA